MRQGKKFWCLLNTIFDLLKTNAKIAMHINNTAYKENNGRSKTRWNRSQTAKYAKNTPQI